MTDTSQPPVDTSPNAWKIRHRIVIGTQCGLGAAVLAVIVMMFKLNSEAIARDLLALALPSAVLTAMGYAGIKAVENVKIGRQ